MTGINWFFFVSTMMFAVLFFWSMYQSDRRARDLHEVITRERSLRIDAETSRDYYIDRFLELNTKRPEPQRYIN